MSGASECTRVNSNIKRREAVINYTEYIRGVILGDFCFHQKSIPLEDFNNVMFRDMPMKVQNNNKDAIVSLIIICLY